MSKQQTAVEWLIEQLKKNENIRWRGAPVSELTEQAKAMEKEQIMSAFISGDLFSADYFDGINNEGENYYNQNYNK
jgi:hypothetical protein